jgi:hypothetical protein
VARVHGSSLARDAEKIKVYPLVLSVTSDVSINTNYWRKMVQSPAIFYPVFNLWQ